MMIEVEHTFVAHRTMFTAGRHLRLANVAETILNDMFLFSFIETLFLKNTFDTNRRVGWVQSERKNVIDDVDDVSSARDDYASWEPMLRQVEDENREMSDGEEENEKPTDNLKWVQGTSPSINTSIFLHRHFILTWQYFVTSIVMGTAATTFLTHLSFIVSSKSLQHAFS